MTIARMLKPASGTRSRTGGEHQSQKLATDSRRERLESEAEIAGYIAQLAAEMGAMAETARFDLLAYFLSLGMEAETIARRPQMDALRPE